MPYRHAVMICFALQALGIFILLKAQILTLLWAYVIIFGFGMGGLIVLLPMGVSNFFGMTAFGVITGLVSLVQALGSSSGAFISGLIYDYTGSYHFGLIMYIGIFFLAIIAIFLAGKPRSYAGSS